MRRFEIAMFWYQLNSDEGPPFGHQSIREISAPDLVAEYGLDLIRSN